MRVYTDGACSGNPGPGGWAWAIDPESVPDGVVQERSFGSGGEPQTTNQRMELQAVLEAVTSNPGALEIVSDSTYVVNCFRDRWYEGWVKRGWRNTAKKPVANRDIWEPLIERYLERADELSFTWVKGHSGDRMNDVVDQLAVDARAAFKPADLESAKSTVVSGVEGSPTATGGEVVTGPAAPWPPSEAVWVVGTTEPDADQRDALERSIAGLHPKRDVAVSGLRRGVELEGAERARALGVRLGVVLPFGDPANKWSPADRDRFDSLTRAAEWVVVLDGDSSQPGRAVEQRNAWLQSNVAGAIVVGDIAMAAALEGFGLSVVAID